MGALEYVSAVCKRPLDSRPQILTILLVDFAETEAAYTLVRLIQRFPDIRLPDGETIALTGAEKQTTSLVLSITDGCRVRISP